MNMRMVARECNIALGTLYNYYSDKNELLITTVESVWIDIFHRRNGYEELDSFPDYIVHIFRCVREGAEEYPGFFTAHSVSLAKGKRDEARSMMERYFKHMKLGNDNSPSFGSCGWNAYDTENLCLCMDGSDWIPFNEEFF